MLIPRSQLTYKYVALCIMAINQQLNNANYCHMV